MVAAVTTALKPKDIFCQDFRPKGSSQGIPGVRPLRILQVRMKSKQLSNFPLLAAHDQWNIERGYQLQKIVQALKEIDADVMALQEIDIGCERSDSADVGK